MDRELLSQAKRLLQSTQDILDQQARAGDNFNVFRLLDIEEKEASHSRFIAGLLDPRGPHGQGSVFLQRFLCHVGLNDWIEAGKARVCPEHYIGPVVEAGEDSTGGQIDIFITDDTRHVSIENKIRASEGSQQVARYCNYKTDANQVLFLTLKGDEADTRKTNYMPISYRKHIIPWLEEFHKNCAWIPVLKETIGQYINTIGSLLGGSTMNESIRHLFRAYTRAAYQLYSNYDRFVDECVRQFAREVEEQVWKDPSSSNWKIENQIDVDASANGSGLIIESSNWANISKPSCARESDKRQFGIKWEREPRNGRESVYGFVAHKDCFCRRQMDNRLAQAKDHMKEERGIEFCSDQWWPIRASMREANFQSDLNQLEILLDEGRRHDLVNCVAGRLIELVKVCDHNLR